MENEQHTSAEPDGDQQIPPPPPHLTKRLTKRKDAGWYTGAAAGIAAYIGIDPIWVRLAFVVSSLFGGIGIAVYIVAAFLPDATPAEMQAQPIPQRPYNQKWTTKEWYHGSGRFFGIAAVIVVALSIPNAWNFGGIGFVVAIVLAAAGLYLLSDADHVATRERFFGVAQPVVHVPGDAEQATSSYSMPSDFRPPEDPEVARQREERREARRVAKRERTIVEYTTLGLALLTFGVLAIVDRATSYSFDFATMSAAVLLVLGIGVVVGSWVGRSFTLMALAILLMPVVVLANLVHVDFRDGIGRDAWVPSSSAEVRSEYRLGAGELVVDLTRVDLANGETKDVNVHLSAGHIIVRLPLTAAYDVTADTKYGSLDMLPATESRDANGVPIPGASSVDYVSSSLGSNRTGHQQGPVTYGTSTGKFVVHASVDHGVVSVERWTNESAPAVTQGFHPPSTVTTLTTIPQTTTTEVAR